MTNEEKAVLAVNEAFYEAFISNDYSAMEALWATEADIAVIHPGWSPLHGRDAVMDSWYRILSTPGTASLHCSDAKVYILDGTAFVICTENFEDVELVATNIFVQERGSWKMVHHQAGPRSPSNRTIPADSVH